MTPGRPNDLARFLARPPSPPSPPSSASSPSSPASPSPPPDTGSGPPPAQLPGQAGRSRPHPEPGEHCDLCSEPIPVTHPHAVDTVERGIRCVCQPCGLLFRDRAAGDGRFRTIPDRWVHEAGFTLSAADWERLRIPVGMAFFFVNSTLDRVVACYPSPAGATESLLPLDAWADLVAGTRLVRDLSPDVEAVLVFPDQPTGHRTAGTSPARYACHLVPIDACYELVGRVRMRWTGFDGGPDAWAEIDEFVDRVRSRSHPLPAAG